MWHRTRVTVAAVGLTILAADGCGGGNGTLSSLEAEARACACGILVGLSFDDCYSWLATQAAIKGRPAMTGCALYATTCDAFEQCLFDQPLVPCDGIDPPTCDGDKLRWCYLGKMTTWDCAAQGLQCLVGDDGQARCGESTCTDTAQLCDGTNDLIECVSGVQIRTSCADTWGPQTVCGSDDSGDDSCVGNGGDCNSGTSDQCNGTQIAACLGGKSYLKADCADLGSAWTCAVEGGNGDCVPRSGACESPATCDGTRVVHCGPDGPTSLDCVELGMTNCENDVAFGARCI